LDVHACLKSDRGIDPETEVEWFIKFNRSTGFQALGLKHLYTEMFQIFDNEIDWVKRY